MLTMDHPFSLPTPIVFPGRSEILDPDSPLGVLSDCDPAEHSMGRCLERGLEMASYFCVVMLAFPPLGAPCHVRRLVDGKGIATVNPS